MFGRKKAEEHKATYDPYSRWDTCFHKVHNLRYGHYHWILLVQYSIHATGH